MQEEKFGKLIKDIRKKYNLTQKDLADKYHVTYQAVSKWENGKALPDIAILKEISKDFNVSLEDLIEGNLNNKKKNLWPFAIVISIVVIILVIVIIIKSNNNFESKLISSKCEDYKISGIISYNSSKSLIYIPKIEYCGEENNTLYHNIKCTLYETDNDITKRISDYEYLDKPVTIDEFMKLVTFNVDNYLKICKNPEKGSFYLEIEASDENNKTYLHKIPLMIDDNCIN